VTEVDAKVCGGAQPAALSDLLDGEPGAGRQLLNGPTAASRCRCPTRVRDGV